MSDEKLRQMLIDEIKRQNKPYGLYFEDITSGFTTTQRAGLQAFKVIPVIVYRVYADGRPDELIRGADIVGTPLASFAKILATSDKPEVFNGYCGAESGSVPVSAVSPAILISEIEIEKKDASQDLLPLLPSPLAWQVVRVRIPAQSLRWRAAAFCCCAGVSLTAAQPDPVLDAMQAELKRSMTLTLNQLDKPYFLSYTVDDEHTWSAAATLGGLVSSSTSDFRVPRCAFGWAITSSTTPTGPAPTRAGPRYDLRSFPLEDENPLVLRQYLWLATDSAFKGSLQSIARKRAALRNVTVSEELPDFAPAPAVRRDPRLHAGEVRRQGLGRPHAQDFRRLQRLSRAAQFRRGIQRGRFPASLREQRRHRSARAGEHGDGRDPGLRAGAGRHDRARSGHVLHARSRPHVPRRRTDRSRRARWANRS